MLGTGRATDLLRYLRGPSGASPGRVDWFERRLRRDRVQTAAAALRLWEEEHGEPPADVARIREAAGRPGGPGRGGRRRSRRRWAPASGSELEARAAAAIATAMAERAELDGLAPLPESIAQALAGIAGAGLERAGRGPGQDRRPAPGAGGALRQRLRRLPAGRRVPARRRALRPVPLRAPARVAGPAAAPRRRGRGALPLPRLPGAAETAALPLLPRQRRERRRRGALALPRRRQAAARAEPRSDDPRPRPRRGRPPRRRRAVGDRAGAGDRRARPGRRPGPAARGRRRRGRDRRAGRGAPGERPRRRGRHAERRDRSRTRP